MLGAATKVGHTYADVAGTIFLGDADGEALSVDQVHLIPRRLFFDAGGAHISRATLQSFAKRGMGTDRNDYSLAEFGDMYIGGTRLTATADERRFEAFGAEVRWNLTDESTPFDIYVMKDIRTSVQVALFYEIGSAADSRGELWKLYRQSYGSGLRVVTASGLVYRFDLAAGDEGAQPSVFFQYPWEL